MIEPTSKRIALEELRRALDKIYAASDTLDAKLQNLLNFSSLIISIVSGVQVSSTLNQVGIIFWILSIIAVVLYLKIYRVIVAGLVPIRYSFPITDNFDELAKRYFDSTEAETLELEISEYIIAIEKATETNDSKSERINRAARLIAFMIILLLAAVPLGLLFPFLTLSEIQKFLFH